MEKLKKFSQKTVKIWRGLTLIIALFLALFLVLTDMGERYEGFINDALGTIAPPVKGDGEIKYKSRFGELNAENSKKLIKTENEFNIQAMEEGAVMLRNENGALPLKADEMSVTLFGTSVAQPVYATNGGGANFKSSRGGSLYDAFKAAGFKINDTMFNAYKNSDVRRKSVATSEASIGEVPSSFYTNTLKNSYASNYNDAAIVMFTRYGGEGVDLQTKDADGVPMLSFHKNERDLMKMIADSDKFGKIIVLVNSPFPMDIEWIEDPQYKVDACLAFGAAGDTGFIGIANLLTGKADPSGHLVDSYATDSMSAPAMRNFGNFTYTNHNTQFQRNYVIYAEGIYVGYKYYETRYQDQVLGVNNAAGSAGVYASKNQESWNYADEMAYTFGYGLSYANFTQEVQSIVWDRTAHTVTATVKVTNNGDPTHAYTGKSKSVVQLYAQAPWQKGQAEKSAIQLIGFGKTKLLGKGEDETLTVVADDYLFATYDEKATNGADTTKKGCYVFDAGDYYFAIGADAHDALNNVLAKTHPDASLIDEKGNSVKGDAAKVSDAVNLAELDNKTYAKSPATGEVVCNVLQEINYNHYVDGAITYLTRGDWNTYPESYTGLTATEQLKTDLAGKTYKKGDEKTSDFKVSKNSDIKFADLADVDYDDDATWEKFLDQLSVSELATICGEKMGNDAITSVGKPYNNNTDGPKGLGSNYMRGDGSGITLYVDEVVMASTFNLELLEERGALFAEDALYAHYQMIFGPGADWHRTAYSGRNSEYYSEDPNMSFLCGAAQCSAMQKGGLIAGIKHFAGNDQETNRHGVATFATEQAFRESSLRCFEGALRDDKGGALGVMTCFNRIGATAGAGSYPVQVQILRNEWGFKGVNITDSSRDASDYVHTEECITGGTDMFNNDTSRTQALITLVRQKKDGTIQKAMRTANKHYYYAFSRSNLINGLAHDTVVEDFVPWWKTALNVFVGVFAGLTAVLGVLYVGTLVIDEIRKRGEAK
ncbi:MAG: glycoside hydrolase family 3 protein [Clostridiales bacterium]|nr:glycoside hydrolase family 3 protein [Clostridiales bacterium]